ncbi:MAG: enoyl-ACP reductase [Deltaproteobacteria bacterium HGW-Deltaproteobacteria-13]|jgi:enoyl-[acyl-carrier protein] reductase I|nr:MAG: enoyl-ACP reductase [Deltaproteobacteria bacterium HGW-Deltaproteobacteria-13]
MDFLQVSGKTFLVTGVANKKSVAYFVANGLIDSGAKVIFSVQNEENQSKAQKLFPDSTILICDVENAESINQLGEYFNKNNVRLAGFVHSIAFANYSEGIKPFHETNVGDFLQATNISCFSLVAIANALKNSFEEDASVVTISISSTRATAYGYMGPIKAALDATVAFLAKSLSEISKVRVNAVCAGPLKTSASAGIPGYVNNYLFAEQLTLRKAALKTEEVANTVLFLLSPVSGGINATGIVVDAGMSCNYFDQDVVNKAMR